MTVSSETRKAGPYACDGADTTFDFEFKVFAAADVRVVLTTSAGVESDLTLDAVSSGFTVSLNADQDNDPGGTITTTEAHAAGNTITITSDVADTQGTQLPAGGGWSPRVVERALDRLTILVQQVRLLVAGALRQPVSDATVIGELPTKTARANKYLKFDADGDPEVDDSVVPETATVSAFMETVLDDTTAAAARTTLGAAASSDLSSYLTTASAASTYAPLASPALTGNPTAPTPSPGDNDTSIATTAFVTAAIAAIPSPTSVLPLSLQDGCALSNNGSDATNDIDISAGLWASDDTLAADRVQMLATALTKQLDAAWAVGTNQGMRDTGAIANGTWHIFLIKRVDTGVVDVLASLSASSPTMPTNYTKKRRIGSILRESGAIVGFVQDGDDFMRKTSVLDVNITNPGTSAVTRTFSVPTGIRVKAHTHVYYEPGTGTGQAFYLSDLSRTDEAAALAAAPIGQAWGANGIVQYGLVPVSTWTNTSAQVRSRQTDANAGTTVKIATHGWADPRGRNA